MSLPQHGQCSSEIERLRRVMAAALERVQVGDCAEAEHILSLEVNLDGSSARLPLDRESESA